jgi:flagellar hook-length control protein FliK
LQPQISAALRAEVLPQAAVAAEPVLQNGNEKLHVIFGNNLEIKAEPENQPVQVMQNPGEAPFKEGQQHDSSPRTPQLEFVKVPENEEAAEPVQAAMVSQSTGAVQVNAFQQQLERVLPVKNAEIPEVPLQAGTDYEVPGQIVEQARLIRSGENTEMVIHLKPEHLGDLTLKISVAENGAVTASFHSDNVFVRTIIENSLVQLRQELNDQGLKVDSVEVFSGLQDGQLPQGQGQQAWQQGFQGRSAGGDRTPEEYAEDADDLAAAAAAQSQESVTEDGVDYRI